MSAQKCEHGKRVNWGNLSYNHWNDEDVVFNWGNLSFDLFLEHNDGCITNTLRFGNAILLGV